MKLFNAQSLSKDVKTVVNMEMYNTITSELRVLARATPEDKYLLVTGLIEMENIVAVTGDGTNGI